MKKTTAILLALLLCVSCLSACSGSDDNQGDSETTTLRVGASVTPHAEILAVAAPLLAEQGITLDIVEFTDYVLPNTAVESGDLDANYFQHQPYLDDFNAENGTHIVSVAAIHYEPFGLYAGKCSSLDELGEGTVIAVPNDGTNEARALMLLESLGYITLSEDAGFTATVLDIVENPYNLKIEELEAAQLTHALADVDFAIINGNYAIQAGLNASTDALATEDKDSVAAQTYANILCVKEGNENNPAILALVEALQSDEVRDFINSNYGGAVVPIF